MKYGKLSVKARERRRIKRTALASHHLAVNANPSVDMTGNKKKSLLESVLGA